MEPAEKSYVASKKKWADFELHPEIIEVLKSQNMNKPTRVQQETLTITTNPDRKKFSLLVRSSNGSGKTLCYLLPILNSLKQGVVVVKDKNVGGKVYKNQIFMPQAMIFVQTGVLAQQIQLILKEFLNKAQSIAQNDNTKPKKLNFTIGTMNNDGHSHGDIIISVVKSFLNRYDRKNISLENCSFAALDEIDQIYDSGAEGLAKILSTVTGDPKTKMIVCSATMKKQFLDFYKNSVPDSIDININDILQKEIGHSISLEGVSNYVYIPKSEDHTAKFNFVINEVFKQLYQNTDKIKPKVFIFFNNIVQIEKFKELFDKVSSDITNQSHLYLQDLSVGIIAAKRKINGKQEELTHEQRNTILTKFRNGDLRVLLSTNIIARGIDIRDVCLVINIDAPRERRETQISIDTYLHRVGRTGRYSDRGVALTILNNASDKKRLVESVQAVHKVQIKDMTSVETLHQEILDSINFNANVEEPKAP